MPKAASPLCYAGGYRRPVSGRVRELAALRAEWRRSTLGELRMALVIGGAGLGKTRLAAELVPPDERRALELLTHSFVVKDLPLFGSWADALDLCESNQVAERVCRICGSGLGGLLPLAERGHDTASCAQALRSHLVEWIPGLLATRSRQRPVVLILDDIHLSDQAVWRMLLRLAQDYLDSRVFVLATARPVPLSGNRLAVEVLHLLERRERLRRVALAPLSRQDTRELAAGVLGRDQVPSALLDWLMARTQGNPRFAEGLLEALVEAGADLRAPSLDRVPENVARWIRIELASLDASALAVLGYLAVAGEAVDPQDLAQIMGFPIENLVVVLERLEWAGIAVSQQREGCLGYALAHVLTREVLYNDIGAARRRVMHQQVAARMAGSGQTQAGVTHYIHAARLGDGEAITALISIVGWAHQRWLACLEWQIVSALRELLPAGDERWGAVFNALFQGADWGVLDRAEHYVADTAALLQLRQLLTGVRDLQQQAEVRLWIAGLLAYGAGDADAGVRECRQAHALCQQAGCRVAARLAAIELAKIHAWAGDLHGAEVAARQLLNEAERDADQRAIAEALGVLGHALGWQGRFDAAESVLLRSVEMARATAHSSWLAHSLALLASLDACRGHLASARTRWAQAATCRPGNDPMIGRCGAFIELLAGDLTMAKVYAQQAEHPQLATQSRVPVRLASRAAILAAEQGELPEAHWHLDRMNGVDSSKLGILEPLYWWAKGVVARAEGRWGIATAALQHAADRYAAMGAHALISFVLVDLAEAAVIAGAIEAAAGIAQRAEVSARRTGAAIHQTLHLMVVAWALIGQGRHEAAARIALRAIEGCNDQGYLMLAGRAHTTYAEAIQRSDPHAAEKELREAAALFTGCGAVLRYQQVRTRLEQLNSARRCLERARLGPEALTKRERQVVELAAGGYTAAQIAAHLHIGVRTVETHLARSYPKLGITRKQQLVHRAAELGFTPDAELVGIESTNKD